MYKKIAQLMKEKGVTNYRLAKDIGVHRSTVARWLKGSNPRADVIKRLANYFAVPVDYFF